MHVANIHHNADKDTNADAKFKFANIHLHTNIYADEHPDCYVYKNIDSDIH